MKGGEGVKFLKKLWCRDGWMKGGYVSEETVVLRWLGEGGVCF